MTDRPRVAVFRPNDQRLERAIAQLEAAGLEPVPDPMLSIEPTRALPPTDADVVAFTSKTGADLVSEAGWTPEPGTAIAAIGRATADALREAGYRVDVVPETFSSRGLVAALSDRVDGARVAVARSDHGSEVLLSGLAEAGASVEETVLYELSRPPTAGDSATMAAEGTLDGALFTSSLTVEHVLAAAADRGVEAEVPAALSGPVLVGAIGEPTAETLREAGIEPDVRPETAEVGALITAAAEALDPGG